MTTDTHKVAMIHLDPWQIASMLELPDHMRIVGIFGSFNPMAIQVLVEGDALPETSVLEAAPIAYGSLEVVEIDGRSVYRRLSWSWPSNATGKAASGG